MLSILEIKRRIAVHPEPFLNKLFGKKLAPAGPNKWRVGTRGSLAIEVKNGALVYFDHEVGKGGGCIGLWMRQHACTKAEAIHACAALAEGVDAAVADDPIPDVSAGAVDAELRLNKRPPRWPDLDAPHEAFWRDGVGRLEQEPNTRARISEWRGWREADVEALARGNLISAPIFDLWPNAIAPQRCVCFLVHHPRMITYACGALCVWDWVQLHVRFGPGAKWVNGSELNWIYTPTKSHHGMKDGGNAPFVIAHDNFDPEQPVCHARCECVIICAGEWDVLTVLLAAGWIDGSGKLLLPPGLAIVGIRGEGRGGTDAYLRHYAHWRPRSGIILADADATGLSWFHSQDGRPSFAKQIEARGAKVLRLVPEKPHKDVNDLYRAGAFGIGQIQAMLTQVEFLPANGGIAT